MNHKILIADDEAPIRHMLPRMLGEDAYDFLHARNGKEAFKIASAEKPDLILLDVNMPRWSGWDVLGRLRRDLRTRMIPVIMLTGCSEIDDKVGGFTLGADDYVTKPFETEELRARVSSMLRRKELDLGANPTTGLPGSPAIEQEVTRKIEDSVPFAFLYVDLDHFKAYNDVYGYERGDRVIRKTAEIIIESLARNCGPAGFAGHIGGDDFVIVTEPEKAPGVAQDIVDLFDWQVPAFYELKDRKRGFIETKDRLGTPRRFPLLSLSIGIAATEHRQLRHYAKVVQIAAEMKGFLKSRAPDRRSAFAFDRRRDIDD